MNYKAPRTNPSNRKSTFKSLISNWRMVSLITFLLLLAITVLPFSGAKSSASVNSENAGSRGEAAIASKSETSQAKQTGNSSSDGIWELTGSSVLSAAQAAEMKIQAKYLNLRLNHQSLAGLLATAPLQSSNYAREHIVILTLPLPEGGFGRFRIQNSPMMESALAEAHPDIRTFSGIGVDDPFATTRFSWTPSGFEGIVISTKGTSFIQPAARGDIDNYIVFYGADVSTENVLFHCDSTDSVVTNDELRNTLAGRSSTTGATPSQPSIGGTLRTYRLAVGATAEFTSQFGPDANTALAKITSIVNQVNAIYQRDLAISFTLVANESSVVFTNTATDGYNDANNPNTLLGENQTVLDNIITPGGYDIGHVFGGITVGANSFSFSGVAQIGVVCQNGVKARGASTFGGTNAIWTPFIVVGVAHEMGHEFGAFHSFNATTNAFCAGQRSGADAYEPGSGSTIMGYSVCTNGGTDTEVLQRTNDTYFHAHSIDQILSYVAASGGCAATSATGNTIPSVGVAQNFTIPANTPFSLTPTVVQGGAVTYDWEEFDPAGTHTSPPNTDDGFRPIFRSFAPVINATRTFPSIQYILSNANVPPTTYVDSTPPFFATTFLTGESLPTTNRTMNFRLTASGRLTRWRTPATGSVVVGLNVVMVVIGRPPAPSRRTARPWTRPRRCRDR